MKCEKDLIDLTEVDELKSKGIFLSNLVICLNKVLSGYCNICLSAVGNVLKLYKRTNYTNASLISLDHVQKR